MELPNYMCCFEIINSLLKVRLKFYQWYCGVVISVNLYILICMDVDK